jgi:lipoprotein signal peptidase
VFNVADVAILVGAGLILAAEFWPAPASDRRVQAGGLDLWP